MRLQKLSNDIISARIKCIKLYGGCGSRCQCYGYAVTIFQSILSRKVLISLAGTSRPSAKSFPFRKEGRNVYIAQISFIVCLISN